MLIIVSGALANKPGNGGNAWTRLNWVLGLRRLGFETHFIEQIAAPAWVDRHGRPTQPRDSVNLVYFSEVMERFGLQRHAHLICDHGTTLYGASATALRKLAQSADLLVNISGHLGFAPLKNAPRKRVFFDDDPGYTQFWHAAGQLGEKLRGYDCYFTIGANIGTRQSVIPLEGIDWRPMRVPVVLEQWPAVAVQEFSNFSTVASWRGPYGSVEFGGKTYGQKVHEFRNFIELPAKTGLPFEIVLNIDPADAKDRQSLEQAGWRLLSPSVVASPDQYREFVQRSSAEFSVAQSIYVQTNSGWFSDRTAVYLASGRPALVQNTGFSDHLPTGEGVIAFTTMEEAVAGAHALAANYPRHCRAARAMAEEYFDSDKVLRNLLAEIASS